jgi:hypothetical protein
MTHAQTVLELAHKDAQELHKKISGNIAKAEAATWADVHAMQVEAHRLAAKIGNEAKDKSETLDAGVKSAVDALEASARLVQDKAVAAKDNIKLANTAMLDASHNLAHMVSESIAALRTSAAKAIAPKEVRA